MSKDTVSSLRVDLARANAAVESYRQSYVSQCSVSQQNYATISNLREQIRSLTEAGNRTHEHYQRELEKADKAFQDVTNASLSAMTVLADEAKIAINSAREAGRREELTQALKYAIDSANGHPLASK
jgi:hypothetical protein